MWRSDGNIRYYEYADDDLFHLCVAHRREPL